MGTKFFKLLLVAVFLASFIPFAEMATALEWGSSEIKPGFKVEERYDSNIFYDRTDPKHDFITLLTPTLAGEYGFGTEDKHKVWAGYLGEFGIFGNYTKQNYGNHNASAGMNLDFDKYTLDVDNLFQFTSTRAGTEFTTRTLRKIDTANATLGMHFNKMDFDLGYRYYIVEFLSDTLRDENRYENSVWTAGYFQIQPKTKALLEFDYRNIQYKSAGGRNANAFDMLIGVKGEITAKLTGIIKGGYGLKQYSKDSTTPNFNNAVANIALLYAFNDRTDLTFSYNRAAYESIYSNNNYYIGDHFLADINYRFGGQFRDLIARCDLMYFHNSYPEAAIGETKKRTDDEWAAGLALDYQIKEWASAGVGYRFHQRASNLGIRRYEQNVVDVHARVAF